MCISGSGSVAKSQLWWPLLVWTQHSGRFHPGSPRPGAQPLALQQAALSMAPTTPPTAVKGGRGPRPLLIRGEFSWRKNYFKKAKLETMQE